ncbi:MAG: PLP-dependent aminotransferase family protein [Anaerolineae bacterium]|nr:PLP-dependent aminotransferase family protein [Anaerolineae bacterium]
MIQWTEKFARRTALLRPSAIREILKLTQQHDIISFAGGLPAPDFFPVERVREAAETVLTERAAEALQYSTTEGIPELRDFIAARMSNEQLTVTRENILIVSGAQQGIDLVGRVLLDDGDGILVENPTYLGTLLTWNLYSPRYVTVPTDHDGLRVDELEPALRQNPKLMYLIPNFQNPQGVTISRERRETLVKLLARYHVPVVEDNPYGELRYSGEPIPSLYELDAASTNSRRLEGHVLYAGTFSKVLMPGLRLGWIAAPVPVIEKLVQAKQAADLQSSSLSQLLTYEVARDGFLDQHIIRLRNEYRQRRDVMLAAMDRYFPTEGVTWAKPEGGLFLMVTLPESVDTAELLKEATRNKVAFVPGTDFFLGGAGRNTMRLNFSNARPEMIETGIQRLGKLLKETVLQTA